MVFEHFWTREENEALRAALEEAAKELTPGTEPNPRKRRKSRKGCTRPSLKDLPVTEIREVPPEVEACGGVGWKLVDEEISERLAYQRARFYRLPALVVAAMHAESIAESYCIATDATGAPVRMRGGCVP